MTTTPILGLTLPAEGTLSWGIIMNSNFTIVDSAIGIIQSQVSSLSSAAELLIRKGVANGYAPLDGSGKVPTANLPSAGAGTVTSISLVSTPSWLTVGGSPITSSGVLTLTATSGQTAASFLATPTGSTGTVALRTIVSGDLTGAIFGASGVSHSIGVVPDPGSSAGSTHFLREDGTWSVPPGSAGSFSDDGTTVLTTELLKAKRFIAGGTTLVSGDFAIGSGWGSTASLSAIIGTDQAFNLTITTGGSGITASPTLILTFHNGTWTNSPIALCQQIGGSDIISDVNITTTATTLTIIWDGTPVSSKTYIFSAILMGR